jgi:uncharacterized protein (TIGR02145 family)
MFRHIVFLAFSLIFLSCNEESYIAGISDNPNFGLPVLTTKAVTIPSQSTAVSGGDIAQDGGSEVKTRGVCWGTNPNPTIDLISKTKDGSGIGSFTSSIAGLNPGTTYHLRAYATNETGTQYGQELIFKAGIYSSGTSEASCGVQNVHNPNKSYGTITDREGNKYKTIVIGNQEWMAENLKTSVYRNGNSIPNLTNGNPNFWPSWPNTTSGAWCSNNNNASNVCPYGNLYNWYAVVDSRGLCPVGWHVPTDAEWTVLTNFLSGEAVAGGKMKSTGTQYWGSPNQIATNSSGFSGLPGGVRIFDGQFADLGNFGYFWSSTALSASTAWRRRIDYNNGSVERGDRDKRNGNSVRCLKD